MKATILLPTTGDRGGILQYSVGSVMKQTEQDWELFIVGDGLDEPSTATAQELAQSDPRIHFFPFPKGDSRGETYRHQLLSEKAKGEIVCYLCDRDLYLENHVAVMYSQLQECDLAHSLPVIITSSGEVRLIDQILNQKDPQHREFSKRRCANFGLSYAAHRLDAYKRLPHGWRQTPPGLFTDCYMWEQFFDQDWLRFDIAYEPTIVYAWRGTHPGMATEERIRENRVHYEKYCTQGGLEAFRSAFYQGVFESFAYINIKDLRRAMKRRKWWRLGF